MSKLRGRFWFEAVLGGLSLLFLVLTVLWTDWIEIVFGVDPDHGNGSFEWLVVGASAFLTVAFAVLARVEFRRSRAATT